MPKSVSPSQSLIRRASVLGLLAALGLPLAGIAQAPAPKPELVALVDYHQHLLSPAAADFQNRMSTPSVELPADVARLLRQRAERWNDKATLGDVYTEDGLVFDDFNSVWIRGRAAAADHMSRRFARPFRVTAAAFASEGSSGHLTGFFTRGEESAPRHFGLFYMELAKGGDGAWRIAVERPVFPGPEMEEPITGEQLVRMLDEAGIQRAVVLSVAYWFDMPRAKPGPDVLAQVRAENDWTAQEVAKFPDRLVGFCSFNPLAGYALAELDRCAANPHLKGLKLHFVGSEVNLKNPEHVAKVRRVFAAANQRRLPIIVHARGDLRDYGREHAEIFVNQLLPAAPDIPVQIAHLWGGEGFSDEALGGYAEAVAAGHPATKNLYFDLADAALVAGGREDLLRTIAQRIRQIGPKRILYGSDAAMKGHPRPREAWAAFLKDIPLTDAERRTIAGNLQPYLGKAGAAARQPAPAKKKELTPRIDYHQHLVSPKGAEVRSRLFMLPPEPKVELPPDVARLLRQKAERWNDKTGLAGLYTGESLVFDPWDTRWIRGRAEAAAYMSTLFARPLRLTPLTFATQGSAGHAAGYFTRGEGPARRHFGHFYLRLAQGGDGVWRIAVERFSFPGPDMQEEVDAAQLVAMLDDAGIERAIVLSSAPGLDAPAAVPPGPEAHAVLREENDWTAREVAKFPHRLVAFCGINPLADYRITEIERCAANPIFKGIKLQLDSSEMDYKNPEHVAKLRKVFEAANRHRLPITAHVRPLGEYGREHIEIFLNQILPGAPDVPVQVAHLWGGQAYAEEALNTLAEAVAAGHPATKNLYFDISDVALLAGGSKEAMDNVVRRLRQIGIRRILYGSDLGGPHPPPREAWAAFRRDVPLTEEEIAIIANNVMPYLR